MNVMKIDKNKIMFPSAEYLDGKFDALMQIRNDIHERGAQLKVDINSSFMGKTSFVFSGFYLERRTCF